MTWDQVCGDFEAISLNWRPQLFPNTAIRHWYVSLVTIDQTRVVTYCQVVAQTPRSRRSSGQSTR
jgi:hypothetical protein